MADPADYRIAKEAVGLLGRPERARVLLEGEDAPEFLQGQLTNDVEGLAPGEGCYAALLTHKGKIRTDMRVLRGPDWVWLDAEAGSGGLILETVRVYGIGRDVRARDVGGERTVLSLIGPAAGAAVGTPPPDREHAFVEGEHGLHVATDLGVDVICSAEHTDRVKAALGAPELSREVAECLRIESGRPRLGIDIDEGTMPEEAGINERAVSFTKGCYVGQETVARLHYKGRPNRRLRGLRLARPGVRGEVVTVGDRQAGTLGATCVSPDLGPIALALLRREADPGTSVRIGDDEATATVVELPFDAADGPRIA